jgi:glucokinase
MKDGKKFYIGIDLGGTNVVAVIIDDKGKISGHKQFPTCGPKGPDFVIKNIADKITELINETKIPLSNIKNIGIGSPGPLDSKKGTIMGAVNLPGWKYVELKKQIEKYLNIKTGIENDANCAVYGEKWIGAAKNAKDVVGFTLGTGVGGGIIIDGKLIRGANYNAAEIGHTSLNPDGRLCKCGAHGCLEQYASATAIANFAKERIKSGGKSIITEIVKGDINKITSKTVYEALISRDKLAKEVWDEFIKYLGAGIANVMQTLNPEIVVIAGGVINAGKYLFDPLINAVKKQTFPQIFEIVKIVPARLGELAGAIGAAGIVINESDYYGI